MTTSHDSNYSNGGGEAGMDADSGCSLDGAEEQTCGGGVNGGGDAKKVAHSNSILRIGIDSGQNVAKGRSPAASLVDRCLCQFFRRLGHWIAEWRLPLTLGMLLFSALCSSSIPFTPQQDDLRSGYTPNGARSRRELVQYERHFRHPERERRGKAVPPNIGPISLLVFVQSRGNGTLLRKPLLLEMVQLMDRLANGFPLGGRTFAEFCTDFCQLNEPIRQFTNGFLIRHLNLATDGQEEGIGRLNLSFPFMSILGHQIDLSPHFFGIKMGQDGQLGSFRLALLQFKADPPQVANLSRAELLRWERQIVHFLHREYTGALRPLAFTMGFVADEVVRTGMTLFPFLFVGFAIMCAFSVATVTLSAFYFRQFSNQKILMAFVACCCPLLACASALGLLFWAGLRFGTILCVSPFLVLAIGVDDAFLMLQSWQRICSEFVRRPAPGRSDWLSNGIGQMLEDVGPSITITSATNALAFCIGIFTPTPEIQLFCAGTATAILFDYLYQLFLFTPCLAMASKWEMNCKEGEKHCQKKAAPPWEQNLRIVVRKNLSAFMRVYCQWIANAFTGTFVLISLILYWLFSAQYAVRVVPNITPRKLLLADSVLNEVVNLKDAYILPNYMPVSIFVENVGDLRDKQRMERIKSMVAEFERQPNCLGSEFTHLWLRDYEKFRNSEFVEEELRGEMVETGDGGKNGTSATIIDALNPFGLPQMASFLEWPEYRHWKGFLRFREDNGQLDRFFAIIAFHGPELVEWNSRAELLGTWRHIVDKYDELGAFVWVEEAQFLDQIETLIPATIQSSIATLLCMSLVCSLFMSNLFTVVVATLSIVSICLGAFGMLVAWGIDLDPISMATTIMSIGFSVDFPAHVAYHYHRCGKSSDQQPGLGPAERVHSALLAIGFPLLQCGISTILFVLCLLFVDTYMSEVFVKSMFLVVSLGLIHGLFVVPTMLCALSNLNSLLTKMRIPNRRSYPADNRKKDSTKSQKLQRKGSSKLVVSVAGPG